VTAARAVGRPEVHIHDDSHNTDGRDGSGDSDGHVGDGTETDAGGGPPMTTTGERGGLAARLGIGRRLPAHEVHDVLRSERRSAALAYLRQEGGTTVTALSEAVATAETGTRPAPRNVRLSVYNSLVGTHLPKLAALGLVAYDVEDKRVRPLPAARQVSQHTGVLTGLGVSWAGYYRALGILGLFLVVASLAGVPVLSALDPLVPATVALATFAVSGAYQLWAERRRARRSFRGR
jgi:hypothetical protein